jgi:hypothetical protein
MPLASPPLEHTRLAVVDCTSIGSTVLLQVEFLPMNCVAEFAVDFVVEFAVEFAVYVDV